MSGNAKKEAKKAARAAKRAAKAEKAAAGLASAFRNKHKVTGNPKLMHPGGGKGKGKKKKSGKTGGSKAVMAAPVAMGYSLRNNLTGKQLSTTGRCENAVSIGTTSTAGSFQVLYTWPLNPGNSALFPRAQAQASVFEKFRLKFFEVEYIPLTGTNTAGFFGMYIDVDASDGPDTNINSVMDNKFNEGGSIWVPQTLRFAGPDVNQWYYTSANTALSSAATDRQQFPGVLRIVADKCAANQTLGLIKIRYEFEFTDPKPPPALMGMWIGASPAPPAPTVTPVSGTPLYFPLQIPLGHAHGVSPEVAPVVMGAGIVNNGDESTIASVQSGGFRLNDGTATLFTSYANLSGASATGTANFGTTPQSWWALVSVIGDTITDVWTSTGASNVLPSNTGNANFLFTSAPNSVYMWCVKVTPGGTGIAAGTAAYSSAATLRGNIGRADAVSNYGRLESQVGSAITFTGELPSGQAALDAWCSDKSGSFCITVYSDPVEEEEKVDPKLARQLEAIMARSPLKWAKLLRLDEVVSDDDTVTIASNGQQRGSARGLTSLSDALARAAPEPRKRG